MRATFDLPIKHPIRLEEGCAPPDEPQTGVPFPRTYIGLVDLTINGHAAVGKVMHMDLDPYGMHAVVEVEIETANLRIDQKAAGA